ncbi:MULTISPECIES: hypothetical protein [unclassified Pseudomonas]|uniref:hypothetical protein n=1 Tax=unclassified Pseudomonas TaxID=196821 RepID=UPI00131B8EEF|nr:MULTISPECIES: hypothetical protein [unclassified Pseudomonas]
MSNLLWTKRPIAVNVELATRIGLNEAIVLQQLHFWISGATYGVEHDGKRWIYNSIESWGEQFPFWSTDTIRRTLKKLEEMGVVQSEKLKKREHNHTKYYTIVADHTLLALPEIDAGKLHNSESGRLPESDLGNLPKPVNASCTNVSEKTTKRTTEKTLNQEHARQDAPESGGSDNFGLREALKDLPEGLQERTFRDWHKVRTRKGAILTQTSWERLKASFALITQAGFNLNDAVALAVTSGWTSVEVRYLDGKLARSGAVETPYDDIVEAYHTVCTNLPQVDVLDDKLRARIAERWTEDPRKQRIAFWNRYFEYCAEITRKGYRVEWLNRSRKPNLEMLLTRHIFDDVMDQYRAEYGTGTGQEHRSAMQANA